MKTLIITAALLASTALAARAEGLTIAQCIEVGNAIAALDPPPADKDAPRYKLGAARLPLGLNLTALRAIGDNVEKARVEMRREAGGENLKADSPEGKEFVRKFTELMEGPCPVTLSRIKYDDLHLETNEIPFQVITSLAPMLDK